MTKKQDTNPALISKSDCIKTARKQFLRICPITAGRPTRMTEKGFTKACAAYLVKADELHGPYSIKFKTYKYCRECRGKVRPAELQILKLNRFNSGGKKQMAANKVVGSCDVCGKKRIKTGRNHGVMACSSCMNLQAHVQKRADRVVAEMRRQHGDKYFAKAVPLAPVEDLFAITVLTGIREALGVGSKPMAADLPKIVAEKMEAIDSLETANTDLANQNMELTADIETQAAIIKDLTANTGITELVAPPADMVSVARLLADSSLLAAVNTLADSLCDPA